MNKGINLSSDGGGVDGGGVDGGGSEGSEFEEGGRAAEGGGGDADTDPVRSKF